MNVKPAITPEARIAEYIGIPEARLIEFVSYQKVGRAYVVNTDHERLIFDDKGNFISSEFIGSDLANMVDPDTFDWDSLD